jgi:hypothetical protein
MKRLTVLVPIGLSIALYSIGCGPNTATNPADNIGAPQNIAAVSIDKSTVGLQWAAPTGARDSAFAGYVVQYSGRRDTLGRNTLKYAATGLVQGETAFTLYVRQLEGGLGQSATIRWAPADRFNNPFTMTEVNSSNPSHLSGLRVGARLTDPRLVDVTPANSDSFDVYLYGGLGQVATELQLWSASLYFGSSVRQTLFSTVTTQAGSLDSYLTAFPAASTFSQTSVLATDNTIYYLRLVGENGSEINYARILVSSTTGAFPERSIQVSISLQRVPGLLYADQRKEGATTLPLAKLIPVITY